MLGSTINLNRYEVNLLLKWYEKLDQDNLDVWDVLLFQKLNNRARFNGDLKKLN